MRSTLNYVLMNIYAHMDIKSIMTRAKVTVRGEANDCNCTSQYQFYVHGAYNILYRTGKKLVRLTLAGQ